MKSWPELMGYNGPEQYTCPVWLTLWVARPATQRFTKSLSNDNTKILDGTTQVGYNRLDRYMLLKPGCW